MIEQSYTERNFPSISSAQMLPQDIDDENLMGDQQKQNIVKLTSNFLDIVKHFDQYAFYNPYSFEEIYTKLVPLRINEVEIRQFEMKIHNLQSYFDTYVIHGGYGPGDIKLKNFRSFFSVVFHLLNLMGRMLHFYERHLHEAGFKNIYKNVQNRLAELIDAQMLLDRTINFSLYYVCHYLGTGKELARDLLNMNMELDSITVKIPMDRGFHARPSILVAKIVQFYGGKVELCAGGCRFDASSVLDIQWAGGKIQQEKIKEVIFEGDKRALKDIKMLAAVNYGEDTIGRGIPLPKDLSYLRESS